MFSSSLQVVIIHEVGREDLESVLQFLYLGRVSVAQSSLPSFLRAAEALRIRGLFSNDRAAATAEQDAEERTRGHKRKTSLESDGCSKRASPESKAGRPVGPKGEGDRGEEEAEELPTMKCEPADVVETSWGDGDEVEDEEGGGNQRGKNQHRGQGRATTKTPVSFFFRYPPALFLLPYYNFILPLC